MSLNTDQQLGEAIGKGLAQQESIADNLSPNDDSAQLNLFFFEGLRLGGKLVATKLTYATDSFIIDNPVLGEIDSPVYKIDGGYDSSPEEIINIEY